jgi:hypothetical protein
MATDLTPAQMKDLVRSHFEDFVNKRNAAVIRKNMTPNFFDHDGPGGKPTGVEGDEQMMLAMYKLPRGFPHRGSGAETTPPSLRDTRRSRCRQDAGARARKEGVTLGHLASDLLRRQLRASSSASP